MRPRCAYCGRRTRAASAEFHPPACGDCRDLHELDPGTAANVARLDQAEAISVARALAESYSPSPDRGVWHLSTSPDRRAERERTSGRPESPPRERGL